MKPQMRILGSSSSGNCYLLETENETLIIECGITFSQINKQLDLTKDIVGCLVSHEHKDHSKGVDQLAKRGNNIYASSRTLVATNKKKEPLFKKSNRLFSVKHGSHYKFGEFIVTPFDVKHDANEPLGFIIQHGSFGTLLFATDTYYIEYDFSQWKVDHFFIECNYQEYILQNNVENYIVNSDHADRVRRSHLELKQTIEMLNVSKMGNTKNIVLLHLSSDNSKPKEMIEEIEKQVGIKPIIAKKDVIVDLDIWEDLGI